MPEDVKISGKKFAETLDRVISDPKFREALRTRPTETLPKIGIEISDKKRARLVGQRLSRAAKRVSAKRAARDLPDGPLVAITIAADVDVTAEATVDAMVVVLLDKEVGRAVERIQKANIAKLRKRLSGRR